MIGNVSLSSPNNWFSQTLRPPEYPAAALAKELPQALPSDAVSAPAKASFPNIIDNALQEVDAKMQAASAAQTKVMAGETTNLHQAMISMQEASVAFSLMVEVRNKLVDSYQELMRMQV